MGQTADGTIQVQTSIGEFLDKLTILRIKQERINDPAKLANIRRELGVLQDIWQAFGYRGASLDAEIAALKAINEALWDIEDRIREKEARQSFDAEFIELARSVYISNDERARIKKRINETSGSLLVEEKSYAGY